MREANFKKAVFRDATLLGATIDDAKFKSAVFCNTMMPDGTVNDTDC